MKFITSANEHVINKIFGMVKAIWNGGILADAPRNQVLFVDNRHYFPFANVDGRSVKPTSHTDNCPWKGTESFFDVTVKGKLNKNAACPNILLTSDIRPKMVRAVWNNVVIAEADLREMLFVDNRYYFRFEAINGKYVRPSSHKKLCPWKGTEYFFHVNVEGNENRNAAWTYYEPYRGYEFMKGYLVFNETIPLLL